MKIEVKTLNDGVVNIVKDSFIQNREKIIIGEIEIPKNTIKEVLIDGEAVYQRKESRI